MSGEVNFSLSGFRDLLSSAKLDDSGVIGFSDANKQRLKVGEAGTFNGRPVRELSEDERQSLIEDSIYIRCGLLKAIGKSRGVDSEAFKAAQEILLGVSRDNPLADCRISETPLEMRTIKEVFECIGEDTGDVKKKAIAFKTSQVSKQLPGNSVVMYGMRENREVAKPAVVKSGVKNPTVFVDHYNTKLGLIPNQIAGFDGYCHIIDKIKSGKLEIINDSVIKNDFKIKDQPELTDNEVGLWRDFLQKHVDKVDIFKTLDKIINPEKGNSVWSKMARKKGEIFATEAFLLKNMGVRYRRIVLQNNENVAGDDWYVPDMEVTEEGKRDLKACAKLLLWVATMRREGQEVNQKSLMIKMSQIGKEVNANWDERRLGRLLHVTQSAFVYAMFRKTSKLGLEFFRQQQRGVVFQWSDHDLKRLDDDDESLQNKWWRSEDESVRYNLNEYSAITGSEMREVNRRHFENVIKV